MRLFFRQLRLDEGWAVSAWQDSVPPLLVGLPGKERCHQNGEREEEAQQARYAKHDEYATRENSLAPAMGVKEYGLPVHLPPNEGSAQLWVNADREAYVPQA